MPMTPEAVVRRDSLWQAIRLLGRFCDVISAEDDNHNRGQWPELYKLLDEAEVFLGRRMPEADR